jgi:hypothetical protein
MRLKKAARVPGESREMFFVSTLAKVQPQSLFGA